MTDTRSATITVAGRGLELGLITRTTRQIAEHLNAESSEFKSYLYRSGISGTSTRKREGFKQMMAATCAGDIDLILAKNISRFARNTVDLLQSMRELKDLGVTVRFERDNIDTSTMDGEIMLTLLASFTQTESEANSEAVRWAIRKKYQEGYGHSYYVVGY
ncbi:recombinase family protein [Dermabacteraceae bacterium P7006]